MCAKKGCTFTVTIKISSPVRTPSMCKTTDNKSQVNKDCPKRFASAPHTQDESRQRQSHSEELEMQTEISLPAAPAPKPFVRVQKRTRSPLNPSFLDGSNVRPSSWAAWADDPFDGLLDELLLASKSDIAPRSSDDLSPFMNEA